MRALLFLTILLLSAPAAAQQRRVGGIFFRWGAFAEDGRCFAMAESERRPRSAEQRAFASVAYWPRRGARGQFHVRLSRTKRPGSAVLLKIGDRTFQLLAGADHAWAADPRADAEIVAAMRTGLEMTVESRATTGTRIRDRYGLRGAATAIDAAAIACAE